MVQAEREEAMLRLSVLAGWTIVPALLASSCPQKPGTPVVYRVPILETIVEDNVGLRNVPEGPDGSYTILGGRALRLRAQADSNLKVLINNGELPRRAQSTSSSGWYEPDGSAIVPSSRGFFWDIAVDLPDAATATTVKDFSLTLAYDTVTTTVHPSLTVKVHLRGRDSAYVASMPRPSDTFVDNSDNTKPDNRMEISLVVKGVTLAGWLTDPGRNDGTSPGATGSEDWHYAITLDPDFIERNYGSPVVIEPLKTAALPGHVVPLARGNATPIPLLSQDTSKRTSKPTAAAFTMPGMGHFVVELNAWHNWSDARGPKPSGWVSDPDSFTYSGNAWPFDPRKGSNNADGSDLQAGDYVIVSGTLWQDSAHNVNPVTDVDRLRDCFDTAYKGHGGYLEIHPMDAVRRVDAVRPHKYVVGLSACYPGRPNLDTYLSHPDPPPGDNYALKYDVIVDDRFTTSNAVHAEQVDNTCPLPKLHITANAPGTGESYNAVYVLWWEDAGSPQPRGTAICTPAINPILGPALD